MQPGSTADRPAAWAAFLPLFSAILLTVVIPRLLMLHVSVIDWDESIYALIGQQWLAGHVPHETVFDHKPIGLYALFAAFFAVFGDTIAAIRLMPIAFVGATAWLLARLAQDHFGADRWLGAVTAALYGLLTLTNGGLATNTEILINFFVVLGVYVIVTQRLDQRTSLVAAIAAGASLGMALLVNFLAAILLLGVAGLYLAWIAAPRLGAAAVRRYLLHGACMLAGLVLAGFLLHLPVLLRGDPADYFGLKLRYLTGYQGVDAPGVAMRRVSEALVPYWAFYALALVLSGYAIRRARAAARSYDTGQSVADRRIVGWLILLVFSLVAALASRRFYQHFFLFSVPALVMLVAAFLRIACPAGRLRNFCATWLCLVALVAVLNSRDELLRGLRAHERVMQGAPADSIAAAGDYLTSRLRPGETIYVYDGQPILYFMTRTVPLTRFAFPDTHLNSEVAARLGFTPYDMVKSVLAREPRFIVANEAPDPAERASVAALLHDRIEQDYVPVNAADARAPRGVYERTAARGRTAD
jgi:4-amino-4-deoxy-L-arabinose transferase-like glycosyltransferase